MIFTYPMELFVARHCLLSIYYRWRNTHSVYIRTRNSGARAPGLELQRFQMVDSNMNNSNSSVVKDDTSSASISRNNDSVNSDLHHEQVSDREHVVVTLFIWTTTVTIAMITDDLGVVTALTGAVAASMLGFVLPAIIYFKSYDSIVLENVLLDNMSKKARIATSQLVSSFDSLDGDNDEDFNTAVELSSGKNDNGANSIDENENKLTKDTKDNSRSLIFRAFSSQEILRLLVRYPLQCFMIFFGIIALIIGVVTILIQES